MSVLLALGVLFLFIFDHRWFVETDRMLLLVLYALLIGAGDIAYSIRKLHA